MFVWFFWSGISHVLSGKWVTLDDLSHIFGNWQDIDQEIRATCVSLSHKLDWSCLHLSGLVLMTIREWVAMNSWKPLFGSHLLLSHWPKQVIWPNPEPEWEGTTKAQQWRINAFGWLREIAIYLRGYLIQDLKKGRN